MKSITTCDSDIWIVVCTGKSRRYHLKAADSRGLYLETFLLQSLLLSSFSQFFAIEENISIDLSEARKKEYGCV